MSDRYPEEGEFVIGTVMEIHPYGVMVELDEYNNRGMVHIREISSGWVKNIRNHVKMRQKIVAKVIRVDPSKGHINLSLKRVSEQQRKITIKQRKQEQKGKKLMEYFVEKNNIPEKEVSEEIVAPLRKKYVYLYEAFEKALIDGKGVLKKEIPEKYVDELYELICSTFEIQKVEIKSNVRIECYEPNGVDILHQALKNNDENIEVRLLGSPLYSVKVTSHDYKTAEEILAEYKNRITEYMDGHDGNVEFARVK